MTRVAGVVVGTVKDVEDPDGLGRVQVQLPWLEGDSTLQWAPVATLASGSERGSWWMPEQDDEVLIAFDHGDVDHPFIIGYTWNGAARPPDDGGAAVRRVKTVAGHVLEFDDRPGDEKITIRSNGGQVVELLDGPASITVQTTGGQKVKLEDTPARATVSTSGGQKLTLDDVPPKATLETSPGQKVTLDGTSQTVTLQSGASGANVVEVNELAGVTIRHAVGSVTVQCLRADVTAAANAAINCPTVAINTGALTVNSGVATFTGAVIASTVVAGAVVGSAYTPAPGNTFGL